MNTVYRERLAVLSLVILGTVACGDSKTVSTDVQSAKRDNVAGVAVNLSDVSGNCQISLNGSTADLKIPWPCDFHRGSDGKVRIKYLDQIPIILIESSRPHPDLPNDCETHVRAVKVLKNKAYPSEFSDKVAACPPFQWDEKMFIGLFGKS